MPLQASWLDRRITVLRPTAIDDGMQTVAGEPVEVGKFAAAAVPTSDAERARAGETQATVVYRFLVRSTLLTRQIDPTFSLVFGGVTYGIAACEEAISYRLVTLGRREALWISATARAENAGGSE